MKNFLLKTAVSLHDLCSSKKNQQGENPRILIVSTTGLGDSLWGTPAIRALRQKHPKAYLALLTSPIGKTVFQGNPHLDEIFVISSRLLLVLRSKKFDTALIFHTSQRLALPLTHLTRVTSIIGTTQMSKGLDHYLTHPIAPTPIHEIERRLKIANVPEASPQMELFLTAEEREEATNFLMEQELDTHPMLIGFHPGAKDKFKQWNPKHFIALGKKLVAKKGARILITGDSNEIPLAKSIAKQIPGALSLAGKFPLRVTAALIEKMKHFVTNDTGPMHIAFALGTPTTALFCATDPKLCGPYHVPHAQVIKARPTCSPCIRKQCQVPFCMEQITPEEVYHALP